MRSNLIYGALSPVRNRYMLCQLVSKATRKFHRPNTRIQETMNDVFNRFGRATETQEVMDIARPLAETHRQAA